ncbi:MAG TPA: hypothetical protein VIK80_15985, partial [Flavihumibacter sp.]
MLKSLFLAGGLSIACIAELSAQETVRSIELDQQNRIGSITVEGKKTPLPRPLPLFTYTVNGKEFRADQSSPLSFRIQSVDTVAPYYLTRVIFTNNSRDTLSLSNVYPLQKEGSEACITGLGNHALSRTHLFLPSRQPVNVIVPDNA